MYLYPCSVSHVRLSSFSSWSFWIIMFYHRRVCLLHDPKIEDPSLSLSFLSLTSTAFTMVITSFFPASYGPPWVFLKKFKKINRDILIISQEWMQDIYIYFHNINPEQDTVTEDSQKNAGKICSRMMMMMVVTTVLIWTVS